MSHELFHDVTDPRPRASRTTGGTLALSILAHAAVVAAVIVVPLFAKDRLPDLPWNESLPALVRAEMPAPAPAPSKPIRTPDSTPAVSPEAAPVEAPNAIVDEVERPPSSAPSVVDENSDGPGDPAGVIGAIGRATGERAVPTPPPPPTPIRATSVNMPTKLRDVAPIYPVIAQQARIDGSVIIEAVIAVDGSVRDARVLKSVALLDHAALDAVRQWRYAPTRVNGVAVPVIVTVTVQFRLQR